MSKKTNIHVLMHVPYEGLGCIEEWTNIHGHNVSYTRFYEQYKLPELSDFEWLIIMGGPMGIYDTDEFPWLTDEKRFIKSAIDNNKIVLGICLGSQLIADVLGSKVFPNNQKEIGWFNLKKAENTESIVFIHAFESEFPVFHWHGDTYNIPVGCTHLFYTNVCKSQGFMFNNKVIGLQFHFEVTEFTLKGMVENGMNELVENATVQSASEILNNTVNIAANNQKMFLILNYLFDQN